MARRQPEDDVAVVHYCRRTAKSHSGSEFGLGKTKGLSNNQKL